MKHLIWSLTLLPFLANADYQIEANAAVANINDDFDYDNSVNVESNSTITVYDLRYYFSPVSTEVDSLQLADFYSRSSSIALTRTNLITDYTRNILSETIEFKRLRDIDIAILSARLFTSESIYFELQQGIEQDNSQELASFGGGPNESEPEDDHIYGLGAGYYINDTAAIGLRYELQDTEFGSLSAYERRTEVYQKSVLTLKNGAKLFSESKLSFYRFEDKDGTSETKRYDRGVNIEIGWLVNKQLSVSASWGTEWDENGKFHSIAADASYAINENFFVETAYIHYQSDYHGDEEVTGDGLALNLKARF